MTLEELESSRGEHLARCGVPRSLVPSILEPRETPSLLAVRATNWCTLVLSGGVGCGKTVAACWALGQYWTENRVFLRQPGDLPVDYRWRGGVFAPLSDFVNRSLWDDEDRDFRARVASTSTLVLDDVGVERGDGAAALFSLLSSRSSEERRTILTTNLPPQAFSDRYGARVLSRLLGVGGRIINVHGPDLRAKGAA